MEYTVEEYRRTVGKIYTTSDGHKYIHSKIMEKYIYLKCTLFRECCKGFGKLNRERNLISPLNQHNHDIEDYKAEIFQLKTKCKTIAKHTQINLRKAFDDVTRTEPCAFDISFRECESAIYRARRTFQPKSR